jgi:drug/metabolite transporter (DMT)-like permease
LFLSERVRRDRVLAALVGFCGVVIIAQPSGEWSWGMPAALLAGVGGATVFITIKLLSTTEPPMRVIGWYAVASLLVWGPVCALVWVTPSWWALAMLLLGSGLALMGDWLAANAARRGMTEGIVGSLFSARMPALAAGRNASQSHVLRPAQLRRPFTGVECAAQSTHRGMP